ncbi:MAG: dephospho-CoA kinase [Arachnia sp.]
MTRVGLTGGIASGKTLVADELARLGAFVIDTDVLAREVVQPGTEGLRRIVERFGGDIVLSTGELDRARLGSIVFADADARADLNAIVHPRIRERVRQREREARPARVVVVVIPLLVETGQADDFDLVVVVDLPETLQLERLVARNGGSYAEALARVNAQASRRSRLEVADVVIDNSGDRERTLTQVGWLWRQLTR